MTMRGNWGRGGVATGLPLGVLVLALALAAAPRADALSTACGTDEGSGYMAIDAGPGETNLIFAGSRNGPAELGANVKGTNAMGNPIDFPIFCGPSPNARNRTLTISLNDLNDVARADGKGAETVEAQSGFGPVHRSIVVTMLGGPGRDRLVGHKGDGTLNGGPGRDRIKDTGGNDLIKGGPGRDRIRAKDRAVDLIFCDSKDSVRADRKDIVRGPC